MRFVPKKLRDIKNPAYSCLTATYISEIVGRNVAEIHFPLPEISVLSKMFLHENAGLKWHF